MKYVLKIVVSLTILCLMILKPSNPVVFKLTNVHCGSYNKTWIRINQCRLKAINRHRTVFNFNATFLYPTKSITVHYQTFKRENGYRPWLVNTQIDGCRFLRKPYDALGILLFNIYRNFTNINHTCPLQGDMIVRNMYLTTDVMRLPLPTGDYLLAIDWIFYGKPQFATNVSFQFVEDIL
uniref:MD-2-related lipid-recognition domain-containing protein n=1 Tax=Drosophila melanogaster TaxID=7227 RepID=Q4ABJ5_DROME|nr:uncharacterized protein Dmel_CG33796 [Drosophila melanogaster]AAZ66060.1 uncharacterized protein Dmel_CG33796 [Drosophila melanogaster]|eukprot:NP_001027128.1 uncharacterized protein Dmel_CG33796 [Drosophila melanogaster]